MEERRGEPSAPVHVSISASSSCSSHGSRRCRRRSSRCSTPAATSRRSRTRLGAALVIVQAGARSRARSRVSRDAGSKRSRSARWSLPASRSTSPSLRSGSTSTMRRTGRSSASPSSGRSSLCSCSGWRSPSSPDDQSRRCALSRRDRRVPARRHPRVRTDHLGRRRTTARGRSDRYRVHRRRGSAPTSRRSARRARLSVVRGSRDQPRR